MSKPIEFNNDSGVLCSHGCGQLAKYRSSTGRVYCCESNQNCPIVVARKSQQMKDFYNNNPDKRIRQREKRLEVLSRPGKKEELLENLALTRAGNIAAWNDPVKKHLRLSKISRSNRGQGWLAGNKEEQWFLHCIRERGFPYYWAGNGWKPIAGKFPDFIHDWKPKIIELYGDYWHTTSQVKERISLFGEHGYDCLVIWLSEFEMEPETVYEKIQKFTETGRGEPNPPDDYTFPEIVVNY